MKFTMPKKDTVIRTAILVLALVNNALALFGKSPLPISDESVVTVISFLFTTITALVNWWYNNSFTKPAVLADDYMKSLKEGDKTDKCEE